MVRRGLVAVVLAAALVGTMAGPASAAPIRTNSEQVRVTRGLGLYLNLWGSEVKWLLRFAGGGAVALCAATNVPEPHALLVKVLCGGLGAAGMSALTRSLDRLGTASDRACFQAKITSIYPTLWFWIPVHAPGNCE